MLSKVRHWAPLLSPLLLALMVCLSAPARAGVTQVLFEAQSVVWNNGQTSLSQDGPGAEVHTNARDLSHAWANANNNDLSGLGVFAGQSTSYANSFVRQLASVENTTDQMQSYWYDFHVNAGNVSLFTDETQGSLTGWFGALVNVNGVNVWASSALVYWQDGEMYVETKGEDLAGVASTHGYTWNDVVASVYLGSFAPGESFALEYVTEVGAFNFLTNSCAKNGPTFADNCNIGTVSAQAGGVTSQAPSMNDKTVYAKTPESEPLPEPASLALLSIGLLGMARSNKGQWVRKC